MAAPTVNFANYKPTTSFNGVSLAPPTTTPAQQYSTNSLANLNLNGVGTPTVSGVTNRNVLPPTLGGPSTYSASGAVSPAPVKSPVLKSPAATAFVDSQVKTPAPLDVNAINASREANYNAGKDVTTGAPIAPNAPATPTTPITPTAGGASGTVGAGTPTTPNYQQQYIDLLTKTYSPDAVSSAQSNLLDINKKIADATLSERNQEDSIRTNSSGALAAGVNGQLTDLSRMSSKELADYAIAKSPYQDYVNNALTASKSLADMQTTNEKDAKSGQFNLAPGDVRYDSSGKVIATGAPKVLTPTEQYGSGSIGEYNFAKANGYTGSFTQYQNEDANRKAKAAGSSATAPTLEERNQILATKAAELFSPGYSIPGSSGVPYVDSNGDATPQGWKTALSASGLTRADFIKQFGYLLYDDPNNGISPAYGLTAAEKKLVNG